MNRWHFLMILLALPAIMLPGSAVSQYPPPNQNPPYQPAVPAPSTGNYYGGWPGYSGGGTVAGNALNGMANVISAQGQRNLSNSAAAINWTQARKNEIQNREQWTNTYFAMRNTQRQAMAAERGPNLTMEQLAQIAKQGVPRPLAPNQMDPVTGRLYWPSALQQDCFARQRQVLDQALAMQARYGGLDYANQMDARKAVNDMFRQLKAQIDQIPQPDYMNCRSFLQRIMYATTGSRLS
jgi:hypothetical protein